VTCLRPTTTQALPSPALSSPVRVQPRYRHSSRELRAVAFATRSLCRRGRETCRLGLVGVRLSFALVTASEVAVLTQPYELATLIGDVHPMSFTVHRRPLHRHRLHVPTIAHHAYDDPPYQTEQQPERPTGTPRDALSVRPRPPPMRHR
jgi:hypothetical protein